jgi:hypothetical protein
VLELAVVGGGLLVGLVIGRWWALVAAVGFGVWVALTEEVEVQGWWLGLAYAGLAALGILAGIGLRRVAARSKTSR